MKEKKARKEDEEEAVSISTMAKTIKESMTVFWEFLHADKDTTNLFLTIILQGSKAHLQDPADSELFTDIKTIHQKVRLESALTLIYLAICAVTLVHSKPFVFALFIEGEEA